MALTTDDTLYRVNHSTRTPIVYRLSHPEGAKFHISQVYPLSMDDEIEKGIICLANKDITLPENFELSRAKEDEIEGPGVDYFLSKCSEQ
ncbi:hypothetical protein SCHPADRAFT_909974 [Schizopora paradoxa]|uniref:Uncharacterized protein n=1 Tax=Schizopora paradoxa TaxID=27342 RepID=A0A0H2RBI9_9AGAM|nr:hypothetical protein SCHPADRAFT_909974 [Schizopora paradoxa]